MRVCVDGTANTCAAPSANSSHTIHHEPKFVGVLRNHKGNCVHRVPVFALGSWKIKLLCKLFANCLRTIWFAHVYQS